MVNVLNFKHFSLFVLKLNVGYHDWSFSMLGIIANREDPDQTASEEAV